MWFVICHHKWVRNLSNGSLLFATSKTKYKMKGRLFLNVIVVRIPCHALAWQPIACYCWATFQQDFNHSKHLVKDKPANINYLLPSQSLGNSSNNINQLLNIYQGAHITYFTFLCMTSDPVTTALKNMGLCLWMSVPQYCCFLKYEIICSEVTKCFISMFFQLLICVK